MQSFKGHVDHALSRLTSYGEAGEKTASIEKTAPTSEISAGSIGKFAQSEVIYTQPQFYSPLHTPQNWQIPSKRGEVYMWCRYFTDNEPTVGAAIEFYSNFPMNGFETQCPDSRIKRFYDAINKTLNLDKINKQASKEAYMLGDVFPFAEIACKKCNGSGVTPKGRPCSHKEAIFKRIVIMNPDHIDLQQNAFSEEPVLTLLPDAELKRVVWYKQPSQIYERIPPHLQAMILAGQPIPLSNESASHLSMGASPYGGGYGTSLVRRLFKLLTYKDKLMTAQWIVAERLILPIRIVKIGNEERPAGPRDIADVQAQLAKVTNDPNLTLVTHHAFDYDWVGASGKVLQLTNEYDLINKEMLQGLMINEALLSGQMSGYQSAAIGAEVIIQRIESWRRDLARWIEERIYKPIAKWQGFIDEEATKEMEDVIGEPVYLYPKVKWNDLNIRDDTQQKQIFMQLHDKQIMSTQTLCEKTDLDYDQEVERIRFETAAQVFGQQQQGAGGAAGGMGAPMGGGMDLGLGGGGGGMPGEMPGGDMGGLGGDMGGLGGGDMGAEAPAAGGPPPGGAMGGTEGKILAKGRQSVAQHPPEEQMAQPSGVRLTELEQRMYKMLMSMNIPFQRWAQFPLGPYRVDFAIPQIKLAIECDGDAFHRTPEARAHDKTRDMRLASSGWTVIRFGEGDLKDNLEAVRQTLAMQIHENWKRALDKQKKEREALEASLDKEALTKVSANITKSCDDTEPRDGKAY